MIFEMGIYMIYGSLLLCSMCVLELIDKRIKAKRREEKKRLARMKARRKIASRPNEMCNIIVKDIA